MGLAFVPPLPSLPLDSLETLPRPDPLTFRDLEDISLDPSAGTGLSLFVGVVVAVAAAAIGSCPVVDVDTLLVEQGFGLQEFIQGCMRDCVKCCSRKCRGRGEGMKNTFP